MHKLALQALLVVTIKTWYHPRQYFYVFNTSGAATEAITTLAMTPVMTPAIPQPRAMRDASLAPWWSPCLHSESTCKTVRKSIGTCPLALHETLLTPLILTICLAVWEKHYSGCMHKQQ